MQAIRELGGRFLELDERSGVHRDIGDKKATEKTSQALREGQKAIRQELYRHQNEQLNVRAMSGDSYTSYSIQVLESLHSGGGETPPTESLEAAQAQQRQGAAAMPELLSRNWSGMSALSINSLNELIESARSEQLLPLSGDRQVRLNEVRDLVRLSEPELRQADTLMGVDTTGERPLSDVKEVRDIKVEEGKISQRPSEEAASVMGQSIMTIEPEDMSYDSIKKQKSDPAPYAKAFDTEKVARKIALLEGRPRSNSDGQITKKQKPNPRNESGDLASARLLLGMTDEGLHRLLK